MDTQATLNFLESVCSEAFDAAHNGNTMPINRLGMNPALQSYLNNVHALQAMTGEQWAQRNPFYLEEADRVRVEYSKNERQGQAEERLTSVESKLDALAAQLAKLTEALAAAPAPTTPVEPKAKSKKAKAEAEAEATDEADAETDEA